MKATTADAELDVAVDLPGQSKPRQATFDRKPPQKLLSAGKRKRTIERQLADQRSELPSGQRNRDARTSRRAATPGGHLGKAQTRGRKDKHQTIAQATVQHNVLEQRADNAKMLGADAPAPRQCGPLGRTTAAGQIIDGDFAISEPEQLASAAVVQLEQRRRNTQTSDLECGQLRAAPNFTEPLFGHASGNPRRHPRKLEPLSGVAEAKLRAELLDDDAQAFGARHTDLQAAADESATKQIEPQLFQRYR